MMAKILKGKDVADSLNKNLITRTEILRSRGVVPTLGIIRLGERADDMAYERGAVKRAEVTGVDVRVFSYPEDISGEDLLLEIDKLNEDKSIHGILVFRPLPSHIDDEKIRNSIAPEKDIDGISDVSQVGVYTGDAKGYPPCTAEACMELLKFYGIEVKGKKVAVIGRSQVIGKPVAMMLIKSDATVTVCHTKTLDLKGICKNSDIIIASAGHIGTVTREHLSPGQIVIDVAINFNDENKMVGDVEFEEAEKIVAGITPVPGGVGAVTTGILMKHCVEAAEKSLVE